MNTRILIPALALLAATTFFTLTGCGSADQVEAAFDCDSICDRYKDCFDSDYDAEACMDRCQDEADNDADYRRRVDECEVCADNRACGESFACVDECVGIVP
jgi:hypothetical protein